MTPTYQSDNERKIPIDDPSGKWSDMTLLPDWGEEFYNVYTAKKHGKWVMLKALKPEFSDDPEKRDRMEREFDTKYNIGHPNIVRVIDFEDVPGIGRAIITDDVYGQSLQSLIDSGNVTPRILDRIQTQLPDALEYIQLRHIVHRPICLDTIIFTEKGENIKLIDIGYDQSYALSEQDSADDIRAYGEILAKTLDSLPTDLPKLRKIADKCRMEKSPFRTFADIKLAIEKRSANQIYIFLCIVIIILVMLLIFLTIN